MSHPKFSTELIAVQQPPPPMVLQRSLMQAGDGELIGSITLSAHEVAGFNRARDRMDRLADLLNLAVLPALGGSNHPVAHEIRGLIDDVRIHSGNLLWRHSTANSPEYRARMREADV